MAWKKFHGYTKFLGPSITVNRHGDLLFSAEARDKVIQGHRFVEIYYDTDTDKPRLGFKFTNRPSRETLMLSVRKVNNQVRAKINSTLLDYLGLDLDLGSKSFPLRHDKKNDIWFIEV